MFRCSFCNKEFLNRRSFSNHLTRIENDKFNSNLEKEKFLVYSIFTKELVEDLIEKYKNEELCVYDLYKTFDITKYINLLGIKRTSKEERKTKRYKKKYLKAIQTKYGDNITNISQVKEIQTKKEKTISSTYGSYNAYLEHQRHYMKLGFKNYADDSDRVTETIKKAQESCLEKYGHKNFGAGADAKQRRKEKHACTIASWDYEERLKRTSKARESVCHRGGYSSKPEKRIQHALTELGINFKSNVHLWNYNYDIVIDNIIIEVQGDMWHANPSKYKEDDLIMGKILAKTIWEKDARKRKKAEEYGFRLIEIWEDAIMGRNDIELIQLVEGLLDDIH